MTVVAPLLYQILYAASLCGWGNIALRLLNESKRDHDLFSAFFAGLVTSVFWALFLHLITPLSALISSVYVAVGGILFLIYGVRQKAFLRQAFVFIAFSFFWTVVTLHQQIHYDTGLYHLQSVRWIEQSGLVLGVANLFVNYGFNAAWHAVYALFDFQRSDALPIMLLNTVLMSMLTAKLAYDFVRGRRPDRLIFFAVTFALVILSNDHFFRQDLRSLTSDLAACVVSVAAVIYTLEFFDQQERTPDYVSGALACLLSLLGFTFKLTQIANLIVVGVIGFNLFVIHRKKVAKLSILLVGILVLSCLRALGLSGCILFPAYRFCIPSLPWTIDEYKATEAAQWIESWAKRPNAHPKDVLGNSQWIEPWLQAHHSTTELVIATLIATGVVISLVRRLLLSGVRVNSGIRSIEYSVVGSIVLCGLLLWFLKSPNPRFAAGYLIVFPALILASSLQGLEMNILMDKKVKLAFVAGVMLVFCIEFKATFRSHVLHQDFSAVITVPKSAVSVKEIPHASVNVPSQSDQCWDSTLPCTPYLSDELIFDKWLGKSRFLRLRSVP